MHGVAKSWTRLSDFHSHAYMEELYLSDFNAYKCPWNLVEMQILHVSQGPRGCDALILRPHFEQQDGRRR